jgi:hypothetical protein
MGSYIANNTQCFQGGPDRCVGQVNRVGTFKNQNGIIGNQVGFVGNTLTLHFQRPVLRGGGFIRRHPIFSVGPFLLAVGIFLLSVSMSLLSFSTFLLSVSTFRLSMIKLLLTDNETLASFFSA